MYIWPNPIVKTLAPAVIAKNEMLILCLRGPFDRAANELARGEDEVSK